MSSLTYSLIVIVLSRSAVLIFLLLSDWQLPGDTRHNRRGLPWYRPGESWLQNSLSIVPTLIIILYWQGAYIFYIDTITLYLPALESFMKILIHHNNCGKPWKCSKKISVSYLFLCAFAEKYFCILLSLLILKLEVKVKGKGTKKWTLTVTGGRRGDTH